MMKPTADAVRLTVHLERGGARTPLAVAADIVALAHAAGLAAATVYPGSRDDAGEGTTISLADDAALAVTIIDTDERLQRFLPQLAGALGAGAAIRLEPCQPVDEIPRQVAKS